MNLHSRLSSALLIGLLLPITPASAKAQTDESPARKALAGLLDAMNSTNVDTIEAFVKEHFAPYWFEGGASPRFYADAYLRRANEAGKKLTLRQTLHSEPAIFAAVVECADGKFLQFSVQVEPQPPHRIMMLNFTPTDAKPVAGPAKDDEELVERLTTFIDTLAKADQFSGSVLVAHNGKTLMKTSRGMANKSFDAPNRGDTKFNLASMNKMFTAVAIAQLEERGKLSYDDPIGKHLPDYANEAARSKVTIHQLLTHTSGLGGDIFAPSVTPVRTIDQVIEQLVNEPPRFEPGTQFAYCNAGFVVLGKIVERASGMDYYEYVRENIYKPAGMVDSDCYAIDTPVPNLAVGYTRFREGDASATTQPTNRKSDEWFCNTLLHSARGGPAGGRMLDGRRSPEIRRCPRERKAAQTGIGRETDHRQG